MRRAILRHITNVGALHRANYAAPGGRAAASRDTDECRDFVAKLPAAARRGDGHRDRRRRLKRAAIEETPLPIEMEVDGELEASAAGEVHDVDMLSSYDQVAAVRERALQIAGGDALGVDATFMRTSRMHGFHLRAASYAMLLAGLDPASMDVVNERTLLTPGSLLETSRHLMFIALSLSSPPPPGAASQPRQDLQRVYTALTARLCALMDRGDFANYPRVVGVPAEAMLCIADGRLEKARALLSVCVELKSPLANAVQNQLACAYFRHGKPARGYQLVESRPRVSSSGMLALLPDYVEAAMADSVLSKASDKSASTDDVWHAVDKMLDVFAQTGQPLSGSTAQTMQNAAAAANERHGSDGSSAIGAQPTSISGGGRERGRCAVCGERLRPARQLTADEVATVEGIIEKVLIEGGGAFAPGIFASSTPDEVAEFKRFLARCPPFDVVVDGLNILFGSRRGRNASEIIDQFFQRMHLLKYNYGFKKILVIGRQEMHRYRDLVHSIYREGDYFFSLQRTSSDDGFLLWAAARSGTKCWIYTRDAMGNHVEAIARHASPQMAEKLRNLVRTRRIMPGANDEYIIFPPRHVVGAQRSDLAAAASVKQYDSADGRRYYDAAGGGRPPLARWHAPVDDGTLARGKNEQIKTWLCVERRA